jgi:hypothetical protein
MLALAPAAFALGKAEGLSDKYSFVSSERIIELMAENGWFPVNAMQSRNRRVKDPSHFTHMLTFRQPETDVMVGGVLPEVVLINDHRGRVPAEILAGFMKLICSNGLMVSTGVGEYSAIQIHRGNAEYDLSFGLVKAQQGIEEALKQIADWQGVELSPLHQLQFAEIAAKIKTPEFDGQANKFLERRRTEDTGNDLWTVFNVVQENLLQGGVSGVFNRNRKTRKVKAIGPIQRINQGLWRLATYANRSVRDGLGLS